MTRIFYRRCIPHLAPVLVCVLCLAMPEAGAQRPVRFSHTGREEGLSQSSVNCMIRDRDGFMWFGTQDGLNLYDGKKFRVFRSQPGDTGSLSNNYIVSLCEDEEGFIWAGTMTGGLNRFNKQTERFTVFRHSEKSNSISENTVWTLLSDGKGRIWAGTGKGLNCYEKQTGRFTVFLHRPADSASIASDMILSLFSSHRGDLWVGTAGGLCLYHPDAGSFTRFPNPYDKERPGANTIWAIAENHDGEMITGTNNGLYLLPGNKRFIPVPDFPATAGIIAWSVATQNNGPVWVGTDRGLFQLFQDERKSSVYRHDPVDNYSIADDNVWCLLHDPAGFLWAGTKNGISKTRPTSAGFRLLGSEPGEPLHLSSPAAMAILEDQYGYLWVGTDGGGLNCIDPEKTTVTVYNSANSGLQNDAVWALAEDREGNIWIGNYGGGLHVFRRSAGLIYPLPAAEGNPKALGNNRILALLAATDGTIWIGTRGGGLVHYNPSSAIFTAWLHDASTEGAITGNTVLSLASDKQNRLWAGVFEGGLNLFDPETGKFTAFRKNTDDRSTLSDDNIWAILFDSKGRLWLGTQGGLNYSTHPSEEMTFGCFTASDGLNSNTILGLAEDHQGNIWMSSFNGLSRLNIDMFTEGNTPVKETEDFTGLQPLFRSYDSDNGLQGDEFNQGACHKGKSGTVYFGGTNGLSYFLPGDVKESSFFPPVVVTGIKVFNSEVLIRPGTGETETGRVKLVKSGRDYLLPKTISYIHDLVITYRESVFSFEFASLDYSSPYKNRYAFKMAGFDDEWNYVGTQNSATYTNLDPGRYTLQIRGSNSDGIWNPGLTELNITIVPPFWQTWWFTVSVISLFVLIAALTIKRAFQLNRLKAEKERAFVELQLRTIKSQIDPHFAFNALNTIASMIYSEKPDVTYDYFTRFAMMIRNILRDNEKISRTLAEELDFVKNYLELQKMRFKDKFDYFIEMDEDIPPETPVPKMIIQTYAENALKHGLMHRQSDGKLVIAIRKDHDRLHFSITDNGVGRMKAAELNSGSTRRGLKIIDTIIDLYGQLYHTEIRQKIEDIADENGNAAGTRVLLTICSGSGQREHAATLNQNKNHKV
ncbi:MAG: histidine kinase [Bacteroidales bacterium]|nr:histidine kinase [Bacteroidales bacterium]